MLSQRPRNRLLKIFCIIKEPFIHFISGLKLIFILFRIGNLIHLQQFLNILFLIEKLVIVINPQNIEINFLILKRRQRLNMLISEIVLFQLNQRLVYMMIGIKLRKGILPGISKQIFNQPDINIRSYTLHLFLTIEIIYLYLFCMYDYGFVIFSYVAVDLFLLLP